MKADKKEEVESITIEVGERDDLVVLTFNKVVSWVGIEPVQALKIAEQIKTAAVGVLRNPLKSGSG
jgi:hypothetical protein